MSAPERTRAPRPQRLRVTPMMITALRELAAAHRRGKSLPPSNGTRGPVVSERTLEALETRGWATCSYGEVRCWKGGKHVMRRAVTGATLTAAGIDKCAVYGFTTARGSAPAATA